MVKDILKLNNLTKLFELHDNKILILNNINTSIQSYKVTCIIGPSGCGKTTLLNILAGLDIPNSGTLSFNSGKIVSIGYMMQDNLLLPWRTLTENALLGEEIINGKRLETNILLDHYFQAFELEQFKESYPHASSGGMRQRVALIRTLLVNPSLLLLDEPFSNLDFDIKLKIQRFLLNYQEQNGTTILLVTHDIEDAIGLSDRVIVLSDKPATIKAEIPIDLDIAMRDPVEARKSPKFREYFIQIWDELKYLNNHEKR